MRWATRILLSRVCQQRRRRNPFRTKQNQSNSKI